MSARGVGVLMGVVVGALLGGVIGHASGASPLVGTVVGVSIGAVVGGVIALLAPPPAGRLLDWDLLGCLVEALIECCSTAAVLAVASVGTIAGFLLWHSLLLAQLTGGSIMTMLLIGLFIGARSSSAGRGRQSPVQRRENVSLDVNRGTGEADVSCPTLEKQHRGMFPDPGHPFPLGRL